MNDKKDNQTNDTQQEERNANATRSWEDRVRRDVKELLEAYNGDYSEVLEAYRHAQQAATRRCKQLWRKAMLAKHEEKLAKYELQLATAIIDEMFIQAVKAANATMERATTPNNRAANEPPATTEEGGQPPATTMRSEDGCPQTPEG
jgi:hypothetical protein